MVSASTIRSTNESATFDLAGCNAPSIRSMINDAFSSPLQLDDMIRITFVVGGGKKSLRQRYDDKAMQIVAGALKQLGYVEDRGASCVVECAGRYKTQHDTGKNVMTVVVLPRITGDAGTGGQNVPNDGEEENDPIISTDSPGYEMAVCPMKTFHTLIKMYCPTHSEKRECLRCLEEVMQMEEIVEQKMMHRNVLGASEQSFYDKSTHLKEKHAYVKAEMVKQVEYGRLTIDERDLLVEMNEKRVEALRNEDNSSEKLKKALARKELLRKLTDDVLSRHATTYPPPLRNEEEISTQRTKLQYLLKQEDGSKSGRSNAEPLALAEKDELEVRILQLEKESRGWFEKEEVFNLRVKRSRDQFKAKSSKLGTVVKKPNSLDNSGKSDMNKWILPGEKPKSALALARSGSKNGGGGKGKVQRKSKEKKDKLYCGEPAEQPHRYQCHRVYTIPGSLGPFRLVIVKGSIVDFAYPSNQSKSAIVNAADIWCKGWAEGSATDIEVSEAGGATLQSDREALPEVGGWGFRCFPGNSVTTGPGEYGELKVPYVIHAVGPNYTECKTEDQLSKGDALLLSAYKSALECAKKENIEAVSLSILSAGANPRGKYRMKTAVNVVLEAITKFNGYVGLREVHVCGSTERQVSTLVAVAQEMELKEADSEDVSGDTDGKQKAGEEDDVNVSGLEDMKPEVVSDDDCPVDPSLIAGAFEATEEEEAVIAAKKTKGKLEVLDDNEGPQPVAGQIGDELEAGGKLKYGAAEARDEDSIVQPRDSVGDDLVVTTRPTVGSPGTTVSVVQSRGHRAPTPVQQHERVVMPQTNRNSISEPEPGLPMLEATLVQEEPEVPLYEATLVDHRDIEAQSINSSEGGERTNPYHLPWWKNRVTVGMGVVIIALAITLGLVLAPSTKATPSPSPAPSVKDATAASSFPPVGQQSVPTPYLQLDQQP